MGLDEWHDLFVASAGASAALAGLIIVAMSVNITTIIAIPSMPSRAAVAIATLLLVVVVSIAALIPGQSAAALAAETTVFAGVSTYLAIDSAVAIFRTREDRPAASAVLKGMLAALPVLLVLAGGVLLFVLPAGLYVIAGGILVAFGTSVANAWVLLVEILR